MNYAETRMTFWEMTAPELLKSPIWWHKAIGVPFFILLTLAVIPMFVLGFVFVGIPVSIGRLWKWAHSHV